MKKFALFAVLVAAGLAASFWDRSRASETTLRATVTGVEVRDNENGPDQWFMTVDLADANTQIQGADTPSLQTPSLQTLGPLQARPTLEPGDTVCVIQSVASHRDTTYRRAPTSTVC